MINAYLIGLSIVPNGRRYVSVGANGHQPVMAGFLRCLPQLSA